MLDLKLMISNFQELLVYKLTFFILACLQAYIFILACLQAYIFILACFQAYTFACCTSLLCLFYKLIF